MTLSGGAIRQRALTTSEGHYAFRNLPAGRFTITAAKTGYVAGGHGMHRPSGSTQPIALADGERVGDVLVTMWRHAAISGAIVDEAGEPVVGAQVQAIKRGVSFGVRALVPGSSDVTDDRGFYRIWPLVAGDYILCVTSTQVAIPLSAVQAYRQSSGSAIDKAIGGGVPSLPGSPDSVLVGDTLLGVGRPFTPPVNQSGPVVVYPTTCFPGALSTDVASVIAVGSGEERVGVDLQVVPVPTVRVSGVVTGPTGPAGGLGMRLTPVDDADSAVLGDSAATASAPNGTFRFTGVQPGEYVLRIERHPRSESLGETVVTIQAGSGFVVSPGSRFSIFQPPPMPTGPTLWAEQAVTVARTDVDGVVVNVREGVRVSGRVEFVGTSRRPYGAQLMPVRVMLEAASRRTSSSGTPAVLNSTGQFTTYGVPAGRYFVRVASEPAGWTLSSVQYEGRDVADTPLELGASDVSGVAVTFTDRPTQLSGTVHSSAGSSDPEATVLIFPTDQAMWSNYGMNPRRLRSLRVTRDGGYSVSGLPAGEYFAAAVPDEQPSDWREPEYLERLSRISSRIRLAESETATLDLRSREVR